MALQIVAASLPKDKLSEKDLGTSVADVWRRALEVNYSSYGRALLDWHQKVSYEQDCSRRWRSLYINCDYGVPMASPVGKSQCACRK